MISDYIIIDHAMIMQQIVTLLGTREFNKYRCQHKVGAWLMKLGIALSVNIKIVHFFRTLPKYVAWMKYLSWIMYSNEAMSIVQWEGISNISK